MQVGSSIYENMFRNIFLLEWEWRPLNENACENIARNELSLGGDGTMTDWQNCENMLRNYLFQISAAGAVRHGGRNGLFLMREVIAKPRR